MRIAALITLALLAAAVPAAADQAPVSPNSTTTFGALRPAPASDPYGRLFAAQQALKQAAAKASAPLAAAPKTRVVCGMTVIEVGPALDPKMGVTPPKDAGVRYTIRAIEPPICK